MMFASAPRLIPEKMDSSPILASLSSCEVLERPMVTKRKALSKKTRFEVFKRDAEGVNA